MLSIVIFQISFIFFYGIWITYWGYAWLNQTTDIWITHEDNRARERMQVLVIYLKRIIDLSMASEPIHQFGEPEIMLSLCYIEVAQHLASVLWEE